MMINGLFSQIPITTVYAYTQLISGNTYKDWDCSDFYFILNYQWFALNLKNKNTNKEDIICKSST